MPGMQPQSPRDSNPTAASWLVHRSAISASGSSLPRPRPPPPPPARGPPRGCSRARPVPPPPTSAAARAGDGPASAIRAPLAGRVAAVNVREGEPVADGVVVAVLDAMKMEHAITAPGAGTVSAVHVAPDEVVEAGALLVELE